MTIFSKIASIVTRRSFYHLVSGLAFMAISIVCFFFLPHLARLFNVRLFGALLFCYSIYRIVYFIVLFKKEQRTLNNKDGIAGV
jgi:uncharacterized membrane protein HdeD (DUF308 family)